MKLVVYSVLFVALLPAWQQQPPAAAPASGQQTGAPAGKPLPPEKPLAHVSGETVTVGKLTDLLIGAPDLALNSAGSDPAEFLTWTYLLKKMSAAAQRQGLGKKSPYVDRLDWTRSQVLMMARIEEKNRESTPDSKEFEALYRDNPHRYGSAKTKLIFIAAEPGEASRAKATMDAILAQARQGADFVKLVKQYSADRESAAKDGDFAEITPDSKLPEPIRKTIFTTKPGQLTPVISQPAGLYLFKVMAVNLRPLTDVSRQSRDLTAQQRAGEWMAAEKLKATVKIIHEDFFKALTTTAGPMVSRGAQDINLQASPQTAQITPTTPLAEINGRTMTAADFTNLIKTLPPEVRTRAILSSKDFLRDYAFMLHLVEDAERLGLDKKQPYRNRLNYNRDMTLMQAAVDDYLNNIVVTPDQQQAGYTTDPNKYRFANVRVLYVSYSLTPPPQTDLNAPKILNEPEAREKIEGIRQELLHKKDDFGAYVTRYSEDAVSRKEGGVMRPIAFFDAQVPDAIRQPIFAAKAGEVVGPVKLPNGYYLFKVDAVDVRKYEEVKDQIYEELRQQRFQEWFDGQRASLKVTVEDPEGFRHTVANAR